MTITTRTFDQVNVGATANDGTGDGLRDAFIRVNSNFSNISSVGFNAANIQVTKVLSITGTTAATSSTTGALLVAGGAGIAGNLVVGGDLTVLGNSTTLNTEIVTVTETIRGNLTAANLIANSTVSAITVSATNVRVTGTADAVSTTTGALIVTGGLGVNANAYIGSVSTNGLGVAGNVIVVNGTVTKKYQDSSNVYTSSKTLDFNQGGDELLYVAINSNIVIGYGATIVAGRQVDVTIKNTSGSAWYAHLPNANTSKATGNISIANNTWARLMFTAYGTTSANVVVSVANG
jgi:enhancing lycopene biosynthesis protein 2